MGFVATVSGVGSFGATVDQQSALLATMAVMGPKGDKGDTGATGATGPQGPAGDAATIAVGTTSTLAPGSSATVSNSGTSSAAVFNFGIPEGEKGDKGDTGDTGATGPQGPQGIPGVIAATAPIQYDAPTQTVSIDPAYKPNPFDQSLNTTDSPTFAGQSIFGTISIFGVGATDISGGYFNTYDGSGSLSITPSGITFADATVQTTAGLSPADAAATYYPLTNPAGYIGRVVEVTDNTNAALRITQLGTGEAFRVEDSANPDSSPFVITADGRVGIGVNNPGSFILDVASGVTRIGGTLSVSGNGSNIPTLIVSAASNRTGPALTVTNEGTGPSLLVNDVTSDTTPFIVDAGGNVGVKTASPTTDFEVNGNAKATTITIGTSQALTGVATDAEAVAGASATLAVTPSNLRAYRDRTNTNNYLANAFSAATSGTGASTSQGNSTKLVAAPTSAVGYGTLINGWQTPTLGSSANAGWGWSNRIEFVCRFVRQLGTTDANSLFRILVGRSTTGYAAAGDPTARCIGVRCVNGQALELLAHNGTTLTAVTSSFTPTTQVTYDLRLLSDGAGNVTLWIDGSQVATTAAGPSSSSVSGGNGIAFEAENTGTVTGTKAQIQVSNFQVTVG